MTHRYRVVVATARASYSHEPVASDPGAAIEDTRLRLTARQRALWSTHERAHVIDLCHRDREVPSVEL